MELVFLLILILIIIFIFSKNESFDGENDCANIKEGECDSKLCPSNCKIQHSTNSDKCYCVNRK